MFLRAKFLGFSERILENPQVFKKIGEPPGDSQTPIGSVKNPPIFWLKGHMFFTLEKKMPHVNSLTPPTPNKKCQKKGGHMFFTRKKIEPKKKCILQKAPPQGIANAGGRPTQRRHLGPFKRTDGNHISLRVLPMVFFWLLVRRSFFEFPYPPSEVYVYYISLHPQIVVFPIAQ